MKYAWLSDVHLDHLKSEREFKTFINSVSENSVDGLFITGDISSGRRLISDLSTFEATFQRQMMFVLGNHDMWGSSIEAIQKSCSELSSISPFLKWLPAASYIPLTPSTAVIGHDGWYDMLAHPPEYGMFRMNDWNFIHEFNGQSDSAITAISRSLAHKATVHVMQSIKAATRYHNKLIILTHVPPFKCHECDNIGLAFFQSKMMGDMLTQAAKTYPGVQFTILAGHSHFRGNLRISSNMVCYTAAAEYNSPAIESIIEVI